MKNLLIFCLLSLGLSSCVINEELEAITSGNESRSIQVSNIPNQTPHSIPQSEFAHLFLYIKNQTNNFYINLKNIQLCNIHQSGTYP